MNTKIFNSKINSISKNINSKPINENKQLNKLPNIITRIKEKINFKSALNAIIILIIICILIYLIIHIVYYYQKDCYEKKGFFNYLFDFSDNTICIQEKAPILPIKLETKTTPLFPLEKKEVFHISNQNYTYEQSKCKCESYGARLATKSDLIDAYNNGASWCSYGWSEGQNAFYPTQQCDYDLINEENKRLPKNKQKFCGNPGLNGGHFSNPMLKFGVNCYGVKPKGEVYKLKKSYCPPMNFCKLENNYDASHKLDSDEIIGFNNEKWNM
jgi:hypothetical protein